MDNTTENNATSQAPLTDNDWAEWSGYISVTFGIKLDESGVLLFKKLLGELKEWNAKLNLVSFRDDRELLYRHFADSLSGAKLIQKYSALPRPRIADIGTGAGFPGVPVYLASAYKNITLMESITKKTVFLAHLKEQLPLPEMDIINDRVENIARNKSHRAMYDFVLSRAVSKLSPNLEISIPLLKPGGCAILYKTERSASDEELSSAANAMKLLSCEIVDKLCYTIPREERSYCAVVFKKISATPEAYPRKPGLPEKKPL